MDNKATYVMLPNCLQNTGTLNLLNPDIVAITTELQTLGISVFVAQETNVHWDPVMQYQLYTQCCWVALYIKTVTSTSQEPAAEWYKPGGTLMLAFDPWTSRVVS